MPGHDLFVRGSERCLMDTCWFPCMLFLHWGFEESTDNRRNGHPFSAQGCTVDGVRLIRMQGKAAGTALEVEGMMGCF